MYTEDFYVDGRFLTEVVAVAVRNLLAFLAVTTFGT